jgi:cellobiose-specific phosphotransferase system component IIC
MLGKRYSVNSKQNNEKQRSILLSFFSNPVVGILGSIASIIGVVLAVYFYVYGLHKRQLTFYVHPVKSIVAASNQASRLSIQLDNEPITGSVTSAQIAIWNAGKLPIRTEHILSPLVLGTVGGYPIIEARIRKKCREVVKLNLDTKNIDKGQLSLTWNILEQNDGGIIEVIFAGPVDTEIQATAVIEGQKAINAMEFSGVIKSPAEQYLNLLKQNRWQAYTFLGGGALMVLPLSWLVIRRRRRGKTFSKSDILLFAQPAFFIVMAIYYLLQKPPSPPFGF